MDKNLIVELETENGYISYYKNDVVFVSCLEHTQKIFEHDLVFDSLQDIIKKSSVVIDGGAHAGSHTILYKNINPDLEVFAFEPQEKMFDLLSHNVNQNNLSKVNLYKLALSNQDKEITMSTDVTDVVWDDDLNYVYDENGEVEKLVFKDISYGDDNSFNLGGLGFGQGGEVVQTTTIDGLNLDQCDFIKLDVEGAESLALAGAAETIKKFHPVIIFEHNHHQLEDEIYEEFGYEKETPFEILSKLGYEFEPVGIFNYIARHPSRND